MYGRADWRQSAPQQPRRIASKNKIPKESEMHQAEWTTFVLIHGAWHGGWCWKKLAPLLRAAGHTVYTPTLTGLGERAHLLSPQIGLGTHIEDICALLEYEDLRNVILVGHSYGGMVITGVAEVAAQRLSHLLFLDAFVPQDGQALLDTVPDHGASVRKIAEESGDGWKVPIGKATFGVTDETDVEWMVARMTPQPLRSFVEPVRLTNPAALALPRSYILCRQDEPSLFDSHAQRARSEGWGYSELQTGHDAMITVPEELGSILLEVASP
jgi:pimeloyl-ACP methyl ester carboxylesterase